MAEKKFGSPIASFEEEPDEDGQPLLIAAGVMLKIGRKKFEFLDPCDENGWDDNDGDPVAFKIVETSYKGKTDRKLVRQIEQASKHPAVHYWNGDDVDGDEVWRAWVLVEDCENAEEWKKLRQVREVQTA
jgi:hypothetical protein